MGATLEALLNLQDIETKLRSIREQLESKKRSLWAQQRRAANLEKEITDTREAFREAKLNADKLELEHVSHEEHISKLREYLNQTKTNKEYSAVLVQINTDKANTRKLEDCVLAGLNRLDELKAKEAELNTLLAKTQEKVKEAEQSFAELEQSLSSRLTGLETQRSKATEEIPPQALRLFERACEKHDGEAMASIHQVHPKRAEYICTGCNMSVPLEIINALQSRDAVEQCQTCSRIFHLDSSASVPAR